MNIFLLECAIFHLICPNFATNIDNNIYYMFYNLAYFIFRASNIRYLILSPSYSELWCRMNF